MKGLNGNDKATGESGRNVRLKRGSGVCQVSVVGQVTSINAQVRQVRECV